MTSPEDFRSELPIGAAFWTSIVETALPTRG